jgi:hypothetical protein
MPLEPPVTNAHFIDEDPSSLSISVSGDNSRTAFTESSFNFFVSQMIVKDTVVRVSENNTV